MKYKNNEKGFVLVTSLLIMIILAAIGTALIRNTSVELQIAGNDNLHKKTFYGAEGGAMLAIEVLEQNLNCPVGFEGDTHLVKSVPIYEFNDIRVYSWPPNNLALYLNQYPWTITDCNITDTEKPNISFPASKIDDGELATGNEVSNMYVGGVVGMLPGGALEMAAGYEGKGKSSATGGSARFYDIVSINEDVGNSRARVLIGWRHVVGSETECKY